LGQQWEGVQITLLSAAWTAARQTETGAPNGGYARAGADRALVTECHPVLGLISRGSSRRGRVSVLFGGRRGDRPIRPGQYCALGG
jgi:hypothetical protein